MKIGMIEPVIQAFAYAGIETPDFERWRTVGPAVFGLEIAGQSGADTVLLRADERHHRLAFHRAERSRLAYLGWDVADVALLDAIVARIEASGVTVERDLPGLAATRHVAHLARFVDPAGFTHELVTGARDATPFRPGRPMRGGFVTGDGGLGHAVLIVPDLAAMTAFLTGVLGFRLSDTITDAFEVRFFHTNPRHHSIAIASPMPGVRGLHHLMLEVESIDDVGIAHDALEANGLPIAMTLGRHPNDRMFSFYARVPGGFEVEYGYGGMRVDKATWTPVAFDRFSEWGHKMQDVGMPGTIEVVAHA
jgi:extradiol dioxygenase